MAGQSVCGHRKEVMRLITRQLVTGGPGTAAPGSGYRWIALSNTTLGTLMATINGSIILIALPDIWASTRSPGSPASSSA